MKGGAHVSYIVDQISKHMIAHLSKGSKGIKLKPSHGIVFHFSSLLAINCFAVKNHMFVFVCALIENPAFDSQT